MAEYIEREQAIGALIKGFAFHGYAGDTAVNIIKDIPSVDVQPVVRGEWIKVGSIENTWLVSRCSACGAQTIDAGCYCPNCGADMRGEDDDL